MVVISRLPIPVPALPLAPLKSAEQEIGLAVSLLFDSRHSKKTQTIPWNFETRDFSWVARTHTHIWKLIGSLLAVLLLRLLFIDLCFPQTDGR